MTLIGDLDLDMIKVKSHYCRKLLSTHCDTHTHAHTARQSALTGANYA